MKSLSHPLYLVLAFLLCVLPIEAQSTPLEIHSRQSLDFLKLTLSIDEQAWLRQKKALVVGTVDNNTPPYRVINERHELEGIAADYLGALRRELGIALQVRSYPSTEAAYQALHAGEVDLVDNATQVEVEDYRVQLSPLYAFTELALFAENGDLRDYASEISQARVAATQGMALELYRRNAGQGRIKVFESPLAAMASVLDGESEVYLGDTLSTRYLSSQLFSNQLVVNHSARLAPVPVGFAIAPENMPLRKLLDHALGGLKRCQVVTALALWGSTETCDLSNFREHLDADERRWLEQAKPVQLVISEDLAPYAFFNARGRFNGIASDLLDIIRRKTGLRFEITRVSSLRDADARLRNAQADLSVLPYIAANPNHYLFSRPFVTTPYVIVRKKDAGPLSFLNPDASGAVAVATGYLHYASLHKAYPRLDIEETMTMADALNLVRDGEVDFALAPANLAHYYMAYKYESSLKITGIINSQEARITFATHQDQVQLLSILDKAMSEVSPQEYLQIVGRWRANSATDDKYWEGVTAFTWKALGGLCLMLALAAWWIYSQRQRIIRKRQDLQQRQLILDQLRVAKESAEKASRSKTVFLATMSHEIRTPLNAIIGMLELVLTRKSDVALNTRSVHIAHESAQSLLALIGDILDISRIESGKLTLRPETASLKDLIESVANVFDGLARQKYLAIHLELDDLSGEQVWIDSLKFKQILSNLLSNAIKFTDRGDIHIRCQGQARDEHSLDFSVSVTDSGPGIAASQIPLIFTPFFEIDGAVNTPNAGSGLGLSISHSLSQLMGASLKVQSEVGVGTTMTFEARFERVSADLRVHADHPEQAMAGGIEQPLTVLIVEDHLPSQYLLEQQISYLGHHALIAHNGLEGLALWQEQDIDLIITDCNMPEMSGHDMTLAVRRMEGQMGLRPCTIIGLTAGAQREELERCLASGMSNALAKPVNLADLNRFIPKLNRSPEASTPSSLNGDIQAAMAEHVISSNAEELQALKLAMNTGNRSSLSAIAHKLKGTAYLLNIQGLLALCVTLEELIASDADEQQLRDAVTRLEQALLALNQSLQAL